MPVAGCSEEMESQSSVDSSEAARECGEALAIIHKAMDELNTCYVKVDNDSDPTTASTGTGCGSGGSGSGGGGKRSCVPAEELMSTSANLSSASQSPVRADVLHCLASLRQYLSQLLEEVQSQKGFDAINMPAADLSVQLQSMLSALGVENCGDVEASVCVLRDQLKKSEADRLKQKVELDELRSWKRLEHSTGDDCKTYVVRLEVELARLKQSYLAAKADKKRLKGEKSDLLQQMKHLYSTLQSKEEELIDSYEVRLQDYEDNLRRVAAEKESIEREKWDILMRARESADRSVSLRTQLDAKEAAVRALEEELARIRLLGGQKSNRSTPSHGSANCPNGHTRITASESTPSPGGGISPARESVSSINYIMDMSDGLQSYCESWRDNERPASAAPPVNGSLRRSCKYSHRNSEPDLSSADQKEIRRSKRRRAFGSLSKVFSRSGKVSSKKFDDNRDDRSQASLDHLSVNYANGNPSPDSPVHAGLSDEQFQERQHILDEARGQPMSKWRSSAVVAWLEVVLSMSQYAKACTENVKSGRVLLGMSDHEIELALKMANPLHRRKLRLAIEEHRTPETIVSPKARELDHGWVSTVWMKQLGLGQHADIMMSNLMDGRVLNSLTRREIDKLLGINRRFHQASMMYGIDLLRALNFDKQVLANRRAMCEDADTDPLVWTNQRFIKWARSIDLGEYANNLQDSGVHGAIVVLEPSFSAEAMATALGIPPSRTMIRRHLAEELTSLIAPARSSLEVSHLANERSSRRGSKSANSLGRAFIRSSIAVEEKDVRRRRSFKDSLGRALGRRAKLDIEQHYQQQPQQQQQAVTPRHPYKLSTSSLIQTTGMVPLAHSSSVSNISMAAQSMAASLTMELESTTV